MAKWLAVALLWVTALLNYLDRQAVFSIYPLLRRDLAMSDVQLGMLATAFLWIYGVLSPLSGYLADRYDRGRVILTSLLLWSAVTWWNARAGSAEELLLARAAMGVAEAAYLPAALALLADYHSPRTRSLATGLHQSGLYAGIICGGAGGAWLAETYGWRSMFALLGLAGFAYSLVLWRALKSPPRTAAGEGAAPLGSSLGELARLPGFPTLAGVATLTSIAYWMVYAWLPLYLYERYGESLTAAGFRSTFYIQAGSFAGVIGGAWLADRWSVRTPRGRVWAMAAGMACAAPALYVIGSGVWLPLLTAALVVFGIGRGLFDCNLMPVLAAAARPGLRATGYGVLNFAMCLAGGAMTLAAGALKATLGLGAAMQISAGLLLLGALWVTRIRHS